MNKKLLFGMFLFAGVGITSAQSALINFNKQLNTTSIKGTHTNNSPKALGHVVWHDDFNNMKTFDALGNETSSVPSAWVADNAGQTGPQFGWTTDAVFDGWWTNTFASTSGGNFAELSNGDPTLTPGTQVVNVIYTLTSPVIDVATLAGGTDVILSFEQTGAKFYDETSVEISTNGTTWTRVYDNNYKPMHAQGASNPWPDPDYVEVDIENAIMASATTVQIRLKWTSIYPTNPSPNAWIAYGWLVDDMKITSKSDYDLAYVNGGQLFAGYTYTQVPTTQVSPLSYKVFVKNQGTQNITNTVLTVTDGTITEASPAKTILPAAATLDSLEVDYTAPAVVGTYTIQRSLSFDETDDNPTNNSGLTGNSFKVTDYIYAADNGTAFTKYPLTGLVDQNDNPIVIKAIGNSFDIFNNQKIYGIDFRFFTGTTVNSEVSGELYEYNTAATDNQSLFIGPLAETDFFEVTSIAQVNQIQKITFDTPYTLEAGKTYLVLVRIQSGTVEFASSGDYPDDNGGQGWISIDSPTQPWGTFTDISVVRMNFDPTSNVENSEMFTGVSIFPNPATDKVAVDFNLNSASNVTINVVDVNGKVVNTNTLNNLSSGTNSTELNVANLASGIYSVVIKSNDSSVTRKLVVR